MEELQRRVENYERLLQQILPDLQGASYLAVDSVLRESATETESHQPQISTAARGRPAKQWLSPNVGPKTGELSDEQTDWDDDDDDDNDDNDKNEDGSLGSLGHLTEDIISFTINKPSGYMGSGSDMSWLNILRQKLYFNSKAEENKLRSAREAEGDTLGCETDIIDMIGASYHLDDVDLSLTGHTAQVDTHFVPPKDIADTFVHHYFSTVHPLIPVISSPTFLENYEKLYMRGDPFSIPSYWLMIINLVFATGGRFCESMGSQLVGSHTEFFSRARILGALDGGVLFGIPTLQDVQAMTLTGLYLLGSKFTNRAWNVIGLAIRLAHGLGLHFRIDDPIFDSYQREMRVKTWYAVIYLESTLCLVTGRPTCLQKHDGTGPIPRPEGVVVGSPNAYYAALSRLSRIIAAVQGELYSRKITAGLKKKTMASIEKSICRLRDRLENWKTKIPLVLGFDCYDLHADGAIYLSQRIDLELRYNNTVILICFPYLKNSLTQSSDVGDVKEGGGNSAEGYFHCLQSARNIIDIVTQFTNNGKAEALPWWCLLHYIVCAETIIMLTIVHQVETTGTTNRGDLQQLLQEAKKPLAWLSRVAKADLASARTHFQLTRLLQHVEAKVLDFETGTE